MQQAREPKWLRGQKLEPNPPLITQAPTDVAAYQRNRLEIRQDSSGSGGVCGYYSYSNSWWAWSCPAACSTDSTYFGCQSNVYTQCYTKDDDRCSIGASIGVSELCCTDTSFAACITGIKTDGDTEYTVRACAAPSIPNQLELYSTAFENETSTIKEDGSTSYKMQTHSVTIEQTGGNTGIAAPSATSSQSSGSSAPVGAIVGGVLGGAALIVLIAFGIWFIRHQKKKEAAAEAAAEAARQAPAMTPMGQMPMHFAAPQQNYPPMYHTAAQGSPPMGEQPQYYHEGFLPMDHPQQVPKPEPPPRSPQELPLDNNRNSDPPVEMM